MTLDEEARHLAVAEVELRREFPQVSADAVHEAIEIQRKAFERAPIRDFVPLLVARDVRTELRHRLAD